MFTVSDNTRFITALVEIHFSKFECVETGVFLTLSESCLSLMTQPRISDQISEVIEHACD